MYTLCLVSFIQHNVFEIYLYCVNHQFILFWVLFVLFHCMNVSQIIHSPDDGHCFQFLARNIYVLVFWWIYVLNSLG